MADTDLPASWDALLEPARAVADAVLYEGYVLYPYRKSSGKNQMRWQFGVLAPRAWIEAHGPVDHSVAGSAESWYSRTECLVEAPGEATLAVRVGFLQVQSKRVEQLIGPGQWRDVESLEVDGQAYLSFTEAVPQHVDATTTVAALRAGELLVPITVAGDEQVEPIRDATGAEVARVVRRRQPLAAQVQLSAQATATPFPAVRLRIQTENTDTALATDAHRDDALRRALIATHSVIAVEGGNFQSLLDPPEWAAEAARECSNVHTYPVLVGAADRRDLVLSSPILLYDYPRVAPESPGDLHDAAEIDEILSLRTLTLTDAEKREARATDPRVAALVDRVDAMPPEVMERLHGAIRSLGPAATSSVHGGLQDSAAEDSAPDGSTTQDSPADTEAADPDEGPAWWQPGGELSVSPEDDSVLIAGTRVGRGSKVVLRPRARGTDAHDMFLAGRVATVAKVLLDVDGSRFLAVTLDDDPAADLLEAYGRYYQFSPDELEPVPDSERVSL